MTFDPNRWVQRAPSRHVAAIFAVCFIWYNLQVIIMILVISGVLWLIREMIDHTRQR